MDIGKIINQIDLKTYKDLYVDVRIEQSIENFIEIKNGELLESRKSPKIGAFIRVLAQGNWLYKATTNLAGLKQEIAELASNATLFSNNGKIRLPPIVPYERNYIKYSQSLQDKASFDEKLAMLRGYSSVLGKEKLITTSSATYKDLYLEQHFISSKGVKTSYDNLSFGLTFSYNLRENDKQFKDQITFFADNYPALLEKEEELAKEIEESKRFINAESANSGEFPVILSPSVVGVFAHESFGHKSEADFMIGDENAKKEWVIGKKVGSPLLSIVDSGEFVGSAGYLPIDCEGVEKRKIYLIEKGILKGRIHSQTTAGMLDESPTGNGRAISFEFEPIPRMTSTYVEKGDSDFSKMVESISNGFYIYSFKHGSGLSTFTIAPARAYKIQNGKITTPVKISVISGTIFETLSNISKVGNDFKLFSSISGGCGKFEQYPLPVSFGGPSIVLSKIQVN